MAKPEQMSDQMGTTKDILLVKLHINSRHAQRSKINEARVDYLLANFETNYLGIPVVSQREDGEFYIIDGQHRIAALKRWLGDEWKTNKITCRVVTNLSEAQEADLFLRLNDGLAVTAFDKFRVALHAGWPDEVHIDAIVKGANLTISRDNVAGSIGAVGALRRVYERSDANTLARTLRIIRDAFGDAGFEARVIDGIGHFCQRYNGILNEKNAVQRLSVTRGGVNGLLGKSEVLHKQTGNVKALCVAAAAVEIINSRRGGTRLPSWWKSS